MYHYLIGFGTKKIEGSNQPTFRELLKNFLYYHIEQRKPKSESAALVIKNALPLWKKLKSDIRREDKIQSNLLTEYEEYHRISKNKVSITAEQRQKRFDFEQKLDRVFNVTKTPRTRQTLRRAISDEHRIIDETPVVESRLRIRGSFPSMQPSTSATTDQLEREFVFLIIFPMIVQTIYRLFIFIAM